MKRVGDLPRLLRPHAVPHIGALLLVIVFGMGSALLQQGTFVLLIPTWKALFPEQVEAATAEGAEPDGADAGAEEEPIGFIEDLKAWGRQRGDDALWAILGDEETLAEDPAQQRRALLRVGGIVSAMAVLAAVLQYLMGLLGGRISLRMMVSLRMALAKHLMGLSLRYHSGRRFGDLLSRISSDVGRTTQVVQLVLKDLIQEPLLFIASMGIAFLISWKLTLFVLVGLPLFIVPIGILVKKVRRSSHRSATELGSTFQVLTQMFQGVRTVKSYRAEDRELDRFRRTNEDYYGATMKMVRASTLSRAWTIFFTNFGIAVIVVFAGLLFTSGSAALDDPAGLLLFFLMISQASSHLKRTTRVIAQVSEAEGAARRLQEVLDETADVTEARAPITLESIGDGVRFEGARFEYPTLDGELPGPDPAARPFALEGIELEVRRGETLALVGPSGSGKSTMLDLVARFVDPTEGRVVVGGHDLREVSFDSWTSHYALVTQSPFLFHASIAENIRYGKPEATDAEVEAAARAANIHEFILGLPDGYATDVQDAGTRLSGGQRQRITIARALLRDPELLLLDEATSALDTESEAVVQAALETMMEGRTTIVIAHRLSTIRNADRIAVLDQGRIVEVGTHAELLERGGVYARLNQAQAV